MAFGKKDDDKTGEQKPTESKRTNPTESKGEGLIASHDTFRNPDEQRLLNTSTATDAQGTERITAPLYSSFTPAPTEASKEEIEAAEKRNKLLEDARKQRQANPAGDTKPAKDQGGVGGSQTTPAA